MTTSNPTLVISGGKLLLVDDRKENLFSLGSLLGELGIEIHKASSGTEALALMVDHEFALAIVDVQMPEMDGFELAELMRGADRTKNIPIMFITAASESSGFSFRGYESGGVDFLYKPVNSDVLKSKVRIFMELDAQKKLLRQQMKDLKEAKEVADKARQAAETANELKSAFLANMSHEIRTPLGALIGFAELLEDAAVSEAEKRAYPAIISRCGKNLVHLIDDILDLSKVEAGHLSIVNQPLSPATLLSEVIQILGPLATQKNIALRMQVPDAIPEVFHSDPLRLRQVLMNIVGNALKFTEKGGVTVTLKTDPRGTPEAPVLVFEVRDSGIGLSPAQAQRLFKPFMQADNSVTRRFGGTGLGLILSRRLAQLMGGDVEILESALGKGSLFAVRVRHGNLNPASVPAAALRPASVPGTLEGLRVLLVEDSPDNQVLLKTMLTKKGVLVDVANNGLQGCEKALSQSYDLVLMDIQMPVMDGYQATRRLRDSHFERPIIALTAHAMPEEREKCRQAGCTDYLSKPIDRKLLLDKIASYAPPVSS